MNAAQIVMPAIGPALPELILSVGVLVLILYGAFKGERSTEGVSVGALILLILALFAVVSQPSAPRSPPSTAPSSSTGSPGS